MKENEEKNNQNLAQKNKENNDELHYKKIKIKPIKKEDININFKPNYIINNINKIKIIPNPMNPNPINNKEEIDKESDNFKFEDINTQLDEILENIENDGIEEINKKIKLLNEDKNMFNTISYTDNIKEKDYNFKKIDNTNKYINNRNKMNIHINNYNHFNLNNRHYKFDNRNITNNRYLFISLNNTYRNWKEENNCDNDECDNYLNKTNISLFYKYNKLYNPKKSDDEE